ncbi:MAG: ABC transporter substrate-binding protein [Clostridiales bacterium]|jgi:peptide/nickel transport system substrate-binding protein|nr:ABC transporter substrate-binding protein [Clostridiales bacterium]
MMGILRNFRRGLWILLLIFLAGCGREISPAPISPDFALQTPPPVEAETPEFPIEPAFGGHLRIAMPMPQTLNPLLNSCPQTAQILRLIFEPLSVLAENITFAPSGQSLAITLKDDIFWEDDMPITAADIAFSIDTLRNHAPETAVYRPNVAAIASHNIVDPRTIHINLDAPMWQFMYLLDFPIIPAGYYSGVPMTNLRAARNMHPVGNGPFRFFSYVLATRLELIANENAARGRPYIERVTATVLRDFSDATHAFERGMTDILAGYAADLGRFRALGKNYVGTIPGQNLDFIGFNHARPIFGEIAMRAVINNPSIEAFAELGFEVGEDGILERRIAPALPPIPLNLTIIVNNENLRTLTIAKNLYYELLETGANTRLYELIPADFHARLSSGDFDLAIGTITLQNPLNLEFLRTGNQAAGNYFSHNSAEFNRLLDTTNLAPNEAALNAAAANLRAYMSENLPIISLGFDDRAIFASPRLHGNLAPAGRNIFHNVAEWFIVDN